jgi:dihydrofolate reductase
MITMHVVSSLDGFIARMDNSVGWLESSGDVYEAGVSDNGGEEILRSIGCYVLGSRTYEHALELGWPYGDTPVIVLTNRALPSTRTTVEFHSGHLKSVVDRLRPRFENIWVVGGAKLCQDFLRFGFVDVIRLMIAPVLLGDGLRLFGACEEQRWKLGNVVAYRNGFVQLMYERRASQGA